MYFKWKKTVSHPLMHLNLRLTPFNSHQQAAVLKVRDTKNKKHRSGSEIRWNCSDWVRWITLTFIFPKGEFWRACSEPWITSMEPLKRLTDDGTHPLSFFHCEVGYCMKIAPRPWGNKGVKKKKNPTEISTELDLVEGKITLKDILRLITSHNMEWRGRRGSVSHEHVLHSETLLMKSVETSEFKWPGDTTAANNATEERTQG